ncbi:hypothetical protein OH492_27395 [Vibrio chagasii]|nr:hypothetical protein [Vibrio chagasii]
MDSIDEFKGFHFSRLLGNLASFFIESSANLCFLRFNRQFGYRKGDHHVLGSNNWLVRSAGNLARTKTISVLSEGDLSLFLRNLLITLFRNHWKSFHVTYSIVTPTLSDFLSGRAYLHTRQGSIILVRKTIWRLKEEIESLHANFINTERTKHAFRNYSTKRIFPV